MLLAILLVFVASTLSQQAASEPSDQVHHHDRQATFQGTASLGYPVDKRFDEPIAKTKSQGTFRGNRLERVDEFLAIPYAEPPLNENRFAKTVPARPYKPRKVVRDATKMGNICIQPPSGDSTPQQTQSEDCLILNVYKPKGLAPGKRVPVMFWLYGGTWMEGSIFQPRINATQFVARSVDLGEPVIFVAANYRVGALGFLSGRAIVDAEMRNDAVRNAGLYDQLEALKWVHNHIEAFGGDKTRITLFGESAGAVGVAQMMMADHGRAAKGLFRGAILESGSAATGRRMPATHAEPEASYQNVVKGAGCKSASMTAFDEINCLKTVDIANLTAGNNLAIASAYVAYQPVYDRFFVQDAPSRQLARGEFLNVPFIMGCNLDEGTEFPYPFDVTTDDAFKGALQMAMGADVAPIMDEMLDVWPADPKKGSPYRPDFFGIDQEDTFYPPMGQNMYKRQAASAQAVFFEAGRRMQLAAAVARRVPVWNYRFAQPSPVGVGRHATVARASMGVQHEAEIPFVFAQPPIQGASATAVPEPLRTFASDANLLEVSNAMSAAWIHFAHRLDPNGKDVPTWSSFTSAAAASSNSRHYDEAPNSTLWIQARNMTMVADDVQLNESRFVLRNAEHFWM